MKTYFYLCVLTWLVKTNGEVNTNSNTVIEYGNIKNETTDLADDFLQGICRGSAVNETYRNACCSYVQRQFFKKWYNGGSYLTSYLSTLRSWRCSEFENECKNPLFKFNQFLSLVYDHFCNRNAMMEKCTEDLHTITLSNHFQATPLSYSKNDDPIITEKTWDNITMSLKPEKMNIRELNDPCVQVALFDRPSGGIGRFHEIVQPFTPFCPMTWAGYDIETAMTRNVSPWDSFSLRCRASIIICMVVAAVLGSFIIVGNLIIVSVYISVPKLRNSQAVFKISIAIGDLLAGLIVFPNIIIFQYWMFISPRYMGSIITNENTILNNTGELTHRQPGGGVRSVIPSGYISFVGFFTTLSLIVSMYTLITATVDRFWAIFRPLKYSKAKAKKYAKYACGVVWVCAVIVASVPLFVPSMKYSIVVSIMATSVGTTAMILLTVAFGIPLLTLCAFNIATFRAAQKHAKIRQRLQSSTSKTKKPEEDDMEKRLRKILGLMVGVFSACMFPMFFLLVLLQFFDNLVFFNPKTLDPQAAMTSNSIEYCATFLFLSNSLWNCFIYSARGEDFRNAAKSLGFFTIVSSAASYVATSARRLSDAPNNYRRKSSSSSVGTVRTAISNSSRLPSTGDSSVFVHDTASSASATTYRSKSSVESVTPRIYYSNVSNKKEYKNNEADNNGYVNDDSTFGSFAIDAGADRLYLSVMENIEEEKEEHTDV